MDRADCTQKVCHSDGAHRALCKYTLHANVYATSTPLGPYMPNAVHAIIHVPMTIGTPLGLHTTTVVHVHIRAYTYKGAPLGLQMPNAVVYAHPRKMRLTSSSKISDRTPRHGKQHAAVQHHTSSTRPFPGPVCGLYARVLNSHAQTNTQTRKPIDTYITAATHAQFAAKSAKLVPFAGRLNTATGTDGDRPRGPHHAGPVQAPRIQVFEA